ncbi:MAG: hypothetical protein PWQ63_1569 [Methanolobus sp.]|nr:hypothetical protein [Methanolobus sp.]MDK2948409.1 hypothetical protein [Methanolobus sp.]
MDSVKTYAYDDLDRLTSAGMSVNSVPTYQRDFTYDPYGCIRQVDDNGTTISSYGYSLAPFHAPISYNNESLDYDANGNLVEDEDFIYVYNDANQLSEVLYAANESLVEKYWYDANGQRVKKQNSAGEFTYYVNQFYEIDNGTATSYFFRDAERIAKQTDEGMEWYLSDHLGSTTLLINESGLEVERTEYYPYGEVQSGGLEKYGFTGKENDADTGLMYYGARYYSPEYRVFVQPDTMLPDPYNPQVLNRYAYSLNNPLKYNDPSGHNALIVEGVALAIEAVSTGLFLKDFNAWNHYDMSHEDFAISCMFEVVPAGMFMKKSKFARNVLKNPTEILKVGDKAADLAVGLGKNGDTILKTLDSEGVEAAFTTSTKIISEDLAATNVEEAGFLAYDGLVFTATGVYDSEKTKQDNKNTNVQTDSHYPYETRTQEIASRAIYNLAYIWGVDLNDFTFSSDKLVMA